MMLNRRRNFEIGSRIPQAKSNLDFLIHRFQCTKENSFCPSGLIADALITCKHSNTPSGEDIVAVCSEEGYIHIVKTTESAPVRSIKSWQAHKNVIFDVCWLANCPIIFTASGDQRIVAWDVTKQSEIGIFQGHRSSVKTIDCHPETTGIFVSGSRDGSIMVWDTRNQGKENNHSAISVIQGAHKSNYMHTPKTKRKKQLSTPFVDPSASVSAVLFQDSNKFISAGASDGCIKVWDMRKPYSSFKREPMPCYKILYPGNSSKTHGYTSLVFDKSHTRLFANCTDNTIYQFNASSYDGIPISKHFGHMIDSYFTKFSLSSDGRYLASGSKECCAYIWKVSQPGSPIVSLSGHTADVSVAMWHPTDFTRIVTCGDDSQLLQWHIGPEDSLLEDLVGRTVKISHDSVVDVEDSNDEDVCKVVYVSGEKTPTNALTRSECSGIKAGKRRVAFQRTENIPSSTLKRRLFRNSRIAKNSQKVSKQAAKFISYFCSKNDVQS